MEFIRGLLQEVEAKLLHDLPELVYDELLMSHLIDELLLFERELRTVLLYPKPLPSPLTVLLREVPLHKWLELEKSCKQLGPRETAVVVQKVRHIIAAYNCTSIAP